MGNQLTLFPSPNSITICYYQKSLVWISRYATSFSVQWVYWINETLCAIWYHFYNLKKTWKTPMEESYFELLKLTLLHGCFSRFLNCANGTKSQRASQIHIVGLWKHIELKIANEKRPYVLRYLPISWWKNNYCSMQVEYFSPRFLGKCDQVHSFLRIWLHFLKIFFSKNFVYAQCTMMNRMMINIMVKV